MCDLYFRFKFYIKYINSILFLGKCLVILNCYYIICLVCYFKGNLNIWNRLIFCEVVMLFLFLFGGRVNFVLVNVLFVFKNKKYKGLFKNYF